jgi:hypothetical protein
MPACVDVKYARAGWIENTYPEETSEVTPVPRTGIEHVGRKNAADYTHDIAIEKKRPS